MADKRLLQVAAVLNVLVGLGAMVQPARFYHLAYSYDGPIDGAWLQLHVGFWFLIALFGAGYWLAARDPVHNRGILVLGVIGKVSFALYWIAQVAVWRANAFLLPAALGDLALAALFVRHLRRHRV
jgi:hypothetical protein